MMSTEHWTLGACQRSGYLALALVRNGEIVGMRVHRTARQPHRAQLVEHLRATALDYSVEHVATESGAVLSNAPGSWSSASNLSLIAVKNLLLGPGQHTHQSLYEYVVATCPRLRRLVRTLPATGKVCRVGRSQTVTLLAAAVALAGDRARGA